MSSYREGVNPLRPYYKPPTIGEPSAPSPPPNPKPFSSGNATSAKYASKARDMFTDLDYNDYLDNSSPSLLRSIKDLLDELMWKYTSVLMAQPFEVAKTILQVRDQDVNAVFPSEIEPEGLKRRISSQGVTVYEVSSSKTCHLRAQKLTCS
jgi:mitochondrial fusion and transport protein UGO1